ncbi:MAG: hypothetical protein KJ674_04635 [Nanoarchaeota archaeon]|nr:hypothetical protein [Nanoarchaeota archaeon]
MIPTEKELTAFIKRKDIVNFSLIAKYFEINNATVSDLMDLLLKKKLVTVTKLGGSKVVRLK